MKTWQKILLVLLALILLVFGYGVIRLSSMARSAEDIALDFLQSNEQVVVETGDWITFAPTDQTTETGFIFYPGARVDAEAYAPALNQIAAQGFLVVAVPMPFNMAIFGINNAANIIAAYPEIEHWVIGGHSLGGAMAARFVSNNPGMIEGIVFWAAYPGEGDSLAAMDIKVVSIYGTLDGLASPKEVVESAALLPGDTIWVPIEGGNHAQFGFYGPQEGDIPAEISRSEQQTQIIDATVSFLEGVGE